MAERQTGPVLETRPRTEETVDLVRAHDVREIKVRNPEGEGLGDLTDVAIDRKSGCIAYAVLAYGGILGFGEKHFAIPWEAVQIRPREKTAIVDTDRRTLDSASGFSRDRMPNEGDWSLIRAAPAQREMEPSRRGAEVTPTQRAEREAPPAESTLPGGARDLPPQPAVQTVAGGWGGQPTGRRAEERPPRAETRPGGAVVEEVRREEPVRTGPQPVTETRPEEAVTTRMTEVRETVTEETRPVTETERSLMTPGPSSGRLTASGLLAYLVGMSYPAGRQDLVNHARQNNAPEGAITVLENFNDRTYRSASDVSEEFGSMARTRQPTGIETAVPEIREEPVRTTAVVEERPESRRVAPSRVHLSAADLQVYLKGMDYPAGRQELVDQARKNDAPDNVISTIEQFSDRTYRDAADVSTEFGRETRGVPPAQPETRQAPDIGTEKGRRERTAGREEMVRPETVVEEPPVTRRARPSFAHLSPIDLQTYLKGMDYPGGRQDLIEQARKNNAPESVIAALEQFGDRTYRSAADVSTEFGNIK